MLTIVLDTKRSVALKYEECLCCDNEGVFPLVIVQVVTYMLCYSAIEKHFSLH